MSRVFLLNLRWVTAARARPQGAACELPHHRSRGRGGGGAEEERRWPVRRPPSRLCANTNAPAKNLLGPHQKRTQPRHSPCRFIAAPSHTHTHTHKTQPHGTKSWLPVSLSSPSRRWSSSRSPRASRPPRPTRSCATRA
jgi:hypothetical protein